MRQPRPDLKPPLDMQYGPPARVIQQRAEGDTGQDTTGGSWQDPKLFGTYSVWVDSTGNLRIKATAPTSDTDGTVVGTQT